MIEPRWYAEAKRRMELDAQERAARWFTVLIAVLLIIVGVLCAFAMVTAP